MTKPLVFAFTTVRSPKGELIDTWELIAFGESNIMHGIWSPENQALVCQYDSIKENLVDVPKESKSGKFTMNERRVEQYYRVTITDENAILAVLNNFVVNYDGQDWKIQPKNKKNENLVPVSEETV